MDGYELGSVLHEDASISQKVLEAQTPSGKRVVKQYFCSGFSDGDPLLKEAIAQAHQPLPMWAALREVALVAESDRSKGFTVNFVLEKAVKDLPLDVVKSNDRRSHPPGLADYELGALVFEDPDSGAKVLRAREKRSQADVLVKMSSRMTLVEDANGLVMEALMQAHAIHDHNAKLLNVALLPEEKHFRLCLVTERLDKDVRKDVATRKEALRRYSEDELLTFLHQVASGLVQAKTKVRLTQNIAHRDIRPDNIFLSADGRYKISGFGSLWEAARVGKKPRESFSGKRSTEYLSPEAHEVLEGLRDNVDWYASDVYSLGMTLLELARLDFPRHLVTSDKAKLREMVEAEATSLSYSSFVKDLLQKMLRVECEERCLVEAVSLEVGVKLGIVQLKKEDDWDNMAPAQLAVEEARAKAEELKLGTEAPAPDLAAVYNRLSRIYKAQKKIEKALDCVQRAIALMQASHGESHPEIATSYSNLALIYKDMSRLIEAMEHMKKALSIRLATLGNNHRDVAVSYNNLAAVFKAMGRFPQAAEYTQKALAIDIALLGESHLLVATSYSNLATIYKAMGRLPQAAEHMKKALSIRLTSLGENHPDFASSYSNLALIYQAMGKLPEAAEYSQKSLRVSIATLGENHPSIVTNYSNLALVYEAMGRLSEAAEYMKKALSIKLATLGESHPDIVTSYNNLATVYKAVGRLPEAEEYNKKALSISIATLGENHPSIATNYNNLALVYHAMERLPEAAEYNQKALAIRLAKLGENHRDVATSYNNLAQVYQEMGRLPESAECHQKALNIRLATLGENHPSIATSLSSLALVYQAMGQLPEAGECNKKALNIRLATLGENHPEVATSYSSLALVYEAIAAEYNQKALSIRLATLGENHAGATAGTRRTAHEEEKAAIEVSRKEAPPPRETTYPLQVSSAHLPATTRCRCQVF